MKQAGSLGGISAWLCFTLPCALALVALAYGLQTLGIAAAGWHYGLKVVAVAVVAQAVWGVARSLDLDRQRASLAFLAHGHNENADGAPIAHGHQGDAKDRRDDASRIEDGRACDRGSYGRRSSVARPRMQPPVQHMAPRAISAMAGIDRGSAS